MFLLISLNSLHAIIRYRVCALKWHPDLHHDSTKVTNTICGHYLAVLFWQLNVNVFTGTDFNLV